MKEFTGKKIGKLVFDPEKQDLKIVPDAPENVGAKEKICMCGCHVIGRTMMHFGPCCQYTGKSYIKPDGTVDMELYNKIVSDGEKGKANASPIQYSGKIKDGELISLMRLEYFHYHYSSPSGSTCSASGYQGHKLEEIPVEISEMVSKRLNGFKLSGEVSLTISSGNILSFDVSLTIVPEINSKDNAPQPTSE